MKDLTFTDILGINDKPVHQIEVPQWNGCVYVRSMDAEERSELEDMFMKVKVAGAGTGKFRKELLKRTLVNKDGSAMLIDDAHATQLMKKNSSAVELIFEKACELNGFRSKDVDTLKKK